MQKNNLNFRKKINKHLVESAEVKKQSIKRCSDTILEAVENITETFRTGHKVLICGNGGSAADSQHIAGEFVCLLNRSFDRPGLPAIALTTDSSILTAYANDFNFNQVFKRQIQALGQPGDLLIAISTSGNSTSIIQAAKQAKTSKMKTVALTGESGQLEKIADIVISIPSKHTQYIQETHLAIEHIICELVERSLFNKES